jgi:hypothetical protein
VKKGISPVVWPDITLSNSEEISPQCLVDALKTLGITLLSGGADHPISLPPARLLASLAGSAEARLRMALILLLLAHPEFAKEAKSVMHSLSEEDATVLRCYYTAAYWLQRKYRERLAAVCGDQALLPDLFSQELGLPSQATPDAALKSLGLRQQALTGKFLNWSGTYEHAALSWLRFREQEESPNPQSPVPLLS